MRYPFTNNISKVVDLSFNLISPLNHGVMFTSVNFSNMIPNDNNNVKKIKLS